MKYILTGKQAEASVAKVIIPTCYIKMESSMRDLVFRNLTSSDRKRKMISSKETIDRPGVRSIIQRHFVCIINEIKGEKPEGKPSPFLYVLKEHNSKEHIEKFFCKIKGNVFVVNQGKLYLVLFMHSLKISLSGSEAKLPT